MILQRWQGLMDNIGTHPTPAAPRIDPREWLVVALIVIVDGIWSTRHMRGAWFLYDFWEYASRFDAETVFFKGHGGHWNIPNALIARAAEQSGFDYSPFFLSLRTLFWATMLVVLWRSMRALGAAPVTAIAAVLIFATFGRSASFQPWLANIPIGQGMAGAAVAIASSKPTEKKKIGLTLLLIFGVISSSLAVLITGCLAACAVATKRLRPWLPCTLIPLLIWFWWAQTYREELGSDGGWTLDRLIDLPGDMFDVLVFGVENYARLGIWASRILVAAFLLRLIVRFWQRNGTWNEVILTMALAATAFSVVTNRVATGVAPIDAPRYSMPIIFLMVLAVAPGIRLAHREMLRNGALVALALVLAYNQQQIRSDQYLFHERASETARQNIRTAARLIADGHEFFPAHRFLPGPQGGGALRVGAIAEFVDGGWDPEEWTEDTVLFARVQAQLSADVRPVTTEMWAETCRPVSQPTAFTVRDFVLVGPPNTKFELIWTFPVTNAVAATEHAINASGEVRVELVHRGGVTYELSPARQTVQLCNITSGA